MPLIIMCGLPSSGKSEHATALNEYFQTNAKSYLIKDDNIGSGLIRNQVFSDFRLEKELRSSLKSEVERYLTKDTVVILDAGNYIKGYRYELYCLSKGIKTTHCVVHCDLLPSDCWNYNEKRDSKMKYEKETFDALIERFEEPDSQNRWDSPLFIVHKDEELPFNKIYDALFSRKPPPPNLSTQCQPLASTNFLYDLDRITQDIIKTIIKAQKDGIDDDLIPIPKADFKISLVRPVTASELTKLRRQFISYTKSHPISDSTKLSNMFVHYVNKNIQE